VLRSEKPGTDGNLWERRAQPIPNTEAGSASGRDGYRRHTALPRKTMQLRSGMASPGCMSCRRRLDRDRRVSKPGATEARRNNAVSAPGKARELLPGDEVRATATAMFPSWRSR
jgi:hypothetical protein